MAGSDALNGTLKHSEVSRVLGLTRNPQILFLFKWKSYQDKDHEVEIHNNFSKSLLVLLRIINN